MTAADGRPAVIFVNYRSEAQIEPRLAALATSELRLVVVDNSGTYQAPKQGEQVIDPGANVGFGAACNLAVAHLPPSCDVFVLHNPDVTVGLDDMQTLIGQLRAQPAPGLLAPTERQGSLLRPAGYRYPTLPRELAKVALVRRSGPSSSAPAAELRSRASTRGRRFGSGALLVASRQAFERVGGFDERYFLYGEDLDLWHRIAGVADVGFAPVVVEHAGGAGSVATPMRRELLRWLGVELFAELHGPPHAWRALRAAHRLALPPAEEDDLAAAIRSAWDDRLAPVAVQARLRPRLMQRGATRSTTAPGSVRAAKP